VVDDKTGGATRGLENISFEAHQDQTEGRGRERTPTDQGRRVGQIVGKVPSRWDVSGAGDDASGAKPRRDVRLPMELFDQGEPRGRGGDGQHRPLRAAHIGDSAARGTSTNGAARPGRDARARGPG
jgi:hypothetical protein